MILYAVLLSKAIQCGVSLLHAMTASGSKLLAGSLEPEGIALARGRPTAMAWTATNAHRCISALQARHLGSPSKSQCDDTIEHFLNGVGVAKELLPCDGCTPCSHGRPSFGLWSLPGFFAKSNAAACSLSSASERSGRLRFHNRGKRPISLASGA